MEWYGLIGLGTVILVNLVLGILLLQKMEQQFAQLRQNNIQLSQLEGRFSALEQAQNQVNQTLNLELNRNRESAKHSARQEREELRAMLDKVRDTVEDRLHTMQVSNQAKLEEMRVTVDEKLNQTLERRLGESFRQVSERLELVYRGLGEMQHLATGVGDLRKVLANVKTRGIWGEVQLGNILEQVLAPSQYAMNVATKKGGERVEFALRLPGRNPAQEEVWLPIDAKFPQEDYLRLVEAMETGQTNAAAEAGKQLEQRIRSEAKTIAEKYLNPPQTTDFGIMFLPTESLFAEVLRRPGLVEAMQKDYRINIAGPTTMAAFINSLSVGFRTLAIEQRTSEVWTILAGVKTDFSKFGDMLEKTQRKLQEASNSIESAAKRTRTIERRLQQVEQLPVEENAIGG